LDTTFTEEPALGGCIFINHETYTNHNSNPFLLIRIFLRCMGCRPRYGKQSDYFYSRHTTNDSQSNRSMKHKHCGGCDQTKPEDQFAKNRLAPDGRQWHCKTCKNEHSRIRKAAIKEGTWNKS
jgi:hypothetical protein